MTTMPTTRTGATCLHLDRRCGCCGLTGEARQPDMAACAEHDEDGRAVKRGTPNAPRQPDERSEARRDAVVRQCGTCATGIDEEDRYDQVRCNNPKSSNYDGNAEATDVCDQWQPR